jgi:hypothetical protein
LFPIGGVEHLGTKEIGAKDIPAAFRDRLFRCPTRHHGTPIVDREVLRAVREYGAEQPVHLAVDPVREVEVIGIAVMPPSQIGLGRELGGS